MTDDEVRALLDAATPGPWGATDDGYCIMGGKPPKGALHEWKNTVCQVQMNDVVTGLLTKAEAQANKRAIATWPNLAAEVLRLRAKVATGERLADAVADLIMGEDTDGAIQEAERALAAWEGA